MAGLRKSEEFRPTSTLSAHQANRSLVIRSDEGEGRILFREGLVCGGVLKGGPTDLRSLLVGGGFVPEADNFLVFCGVIVMINMTAVSWGMLISSSVNSVEQATGFGPLVIIVFLLFGGFYVNTDNIPVWISWITGEAASLGRLPWLERKVTNQW